MISLVLKYVILPLGLLFFRSFSMKYILKICFDGPQLCSFEIVICWYVLIVSSVGYQLINPNVYPTIKIGISILKYSSIPSGLCWSVGSSQIDMPKAWHWIGIIKVSSVLLPNHKPCPNVSIMTSLYSIVYEGVPVNIGIYVPVQNTPLVKVQLCTPLM